MKHTWFGVLLSVLDINIGFSYAQTNPAFALIVLVVGLVVFHEAYKTAEVLDEAEKKSKKASERK